MYQSRGASLGAGNQVGVNGIGEKSPCPARLRLRGCKSRQPWRDARCLCLHLGCRHHADKFAVNIGVWRGGGPRTPKLICCWRSAWSSPWPPRACARWRAADPMRKPPGEKYRGDLRTASGTSASGATIDRFPGHTAVRRANLQGALRVRIDPFGKFSTNGAVCGYR